MKVTIEDDEIKADKPLRTPSGAPTAYARQKYSVFGDGTYPVWDKESALAAIDLRGRLTASQQKKLLRVCKKYAPDEAQAAMDKDGAGKSVDLDELVYFGDAVKSLGDGHFGGYLVRFGDSKDTDLSREFFTKDTDFGIESGDMMSGRYHHGLDVKMGKRNIGRGKLTIDDVGVWLDAQLKMRDEYEQSISRMVDAGKLSLSSGAVNHLVEREATGKSVWLKTWPIGEWSLTPIPAEPRNVALPIKSLMSVVESDPDGGVKSGELETPTAEADNSDSGARLQLRARAYLYASEE